MTSLIRLQSAAVRSCEFVLLLCAFAFEASAQAQSPSPSNPACVLVEKEGKVEIAHKGTTTWTVAQPSESLQPGDRLRTGSRSRAALRWSESSVVRGSELTS